MARASGLYVRIEIRMGEGNKTDTPALGAAILDLKREGWYLVEYESGQEDREAYAILHRSWDISVPIYHESRGAYAVESPTPAGHHEAPPPPARPLPPSIRRD